MSRWPLAAALVAALAAGSALAFPLEGVTLAGFLLLWLAATLLAGRVFVRLRPAGVGTALATAALPVCVAMAATTAGVSAANHDRAWDAARLAPSVAWVGGHEAYAGEREGSVQSAMYPPFWVIAFTPAALADTPAGVLRIGSAETLLFSLLPVLLFLVRAGGGVPLGVVGAGIFVFVSRLMHPLEYSAFQVHADAPSLGLALVACALLLVRPAAWRLPAVALLAWLSVWTKQVMLPIVFVLPLWLLLAEGRRAALLLGGWLAGAGVVVAAVMLTLFPADALWFNLVTIPAAVPWALDGQAPRAVQLAIAFVDLMHFALPMLLPAALGLGPWLESDRVRPASAWVLPALVAAAMVPASNLGQVKFGGDLNTMSPTLYFLLVACIALWLELPQRVAERWREGVLGFVGASALAVGTVAAADALQHGAIAGHLADHPTQLAYEHLVERDPQAFFPTHPLAHLLADGTYPHVAMALHDREHLASLPLSPEHRAAHLPAAPSVVCWDGSWGVGYGVTHYFQGYDLDTQPEGLRGDWWCREAGAPAR